ncbi:MAG: GIY-YIG nuclease family protein [Cetobacterium sp.]
MELGYVYVITTNLYFKENVYKIGCTKNLYTRLKSINATRLEKDKFFIKMFWQTKHYYNLENGLHTTLKQYRQNNEFFQCSYDVIETALSNYLSQQPRDYIFDDAVLIPAQSRNLKWFEKENMFTIEEESIMGRIEIRMNEDVLLKEIQKWIYVFGNEKLYKFAHASFWEKYIVMLKSNFAINDKPEELGHNHEIFDNDILEDLSTLFSQIFM